MSFGEGNLRERVSELESAYNMLQAQFDVTRERWMKRGAYIAKQRERIAELERENARWRNIACGLWSDMHAENSVLATVWLKACRELREELERSER